MLMFILQKFTPDQILYRSPAFILRNLFTEILAQRAVMMIPKRNTEPPVMASSCQPSTLTSSGS